MIKLHPLPLLFVLALVAVRPAVAADPSAESGRSNRGSSVVQGAEAPPVVSPGRPVVPVDSKRGRGSGSAALALIEFADYQCPYCRSFHLGILPKLKAAYIDTGKIRYFYKDFPLPNHAHAFDAAVAAHCARTQGRYWQMQERLYAEQARLGEALYAELGEALELDMSRFNSCRGSAQARAAVKRDAYEGRRLGVRGTPSFVLGRLEGDRVVVERLATGAPAFEDFAREIEALGR